MSIGTGIATISSTTSATPAVDKYTRLATSWVVQSVRVSTGGGPAHSALSDAFFRAIAMTALNAFAVGPTWRGDSGAFLPAGCG